MSGSLGFVHRFEPGLAEATLLVLHGTGGNEHDLIPLARQLAPKTNILSPRGKVLENGAPRFFRRLGMGVFDEEDLKVQSADLVRFVAEAAVQYGFDSSKVYAFGYSNGANIAAATLLLHPGVLAGGVLLRPMMPLEPDPIPNLTGKPVFIAAGSQDPWSPNERVRRLGEALERAGALVELRWENAGHSLQPGELEATAHWLQKTLG